MVMVARHAAGCSLSWIYLSLSEVCFAVQRHHAGYTSKLLLSVTGRTQAAYKVYLPVLLLLPVN